MLAEARQETGLGIITEVMTPHEVELVGRYTAIYQIETRNMQNFYLLREVGKFGKPVVLKRGLSATIEEWLLASEYILSEGNPDVILCERGIRTFETHTRNTLDLNAVPSIKDLSHLPIVVDPSHGTGIRSLVAPMSKAAIAAGADGLLLEVQIIEIVRVYVLLGLRYVKKIIYIIILKHVIILELTWMVVVYVPVEILWMH